MVPFESDAKRLRGFREGKASVLRELYDEHGRAVYAFVIKRIRSAADAADVVQDVFLIGFGAEARRHYSGECSFRSFLLGIARNRLLHAFRERRVREKALPTLRETADADPRCDEMMEAVETSDVLADFVAGMTPRERDFFRAHMVERPPRRVTAERFGMSPDQVRYMERRLRDRAVAHLRRVSGESEVARETTAMETARQSEPGSAASTLPLVPAWAC